MQEVRNAVDQASREVGTRFDFKDTGSTIELNGHELNLHSSTEDRLRALVQVVEEKLVKRQVSLKAMEKGKVEEASKGTVRQTITLNAGIDADKARSINKKIKELSKGVEGAITFDGAGAGAPSRSVAISMVSSLPSIGARPTYSTRTRAMPR